MSSFKRSCVIGLCGGVAFIGMAYIGIPPWGAWLVCGVGGFVAGYWWENVQ